MTLTVFLIIALVVGFYMAWNIGANDVANAFGPSVGSGALTIRKAVVLAAICEFCGAFLVGRNVADTIKGGIISPEVFSGDVVVFGIGMVAALLAAALWLNIATYLSQPVSTTHAIIGAVIGFAVIRSGPGSVQWGKMGAIAASWVISPLVGGVLAYIVYRLIRRFVLQSRHPVYMAKAVVPITLGVVVCILSLSIIYKGLARYRLDLPLTTAVPVAILIGTFVTFAARLTIKARTASLRVRLGDRYDVVESWFGRMQWITACYMAFAHGANDVANAIGPLAGAVQVFRQQGAALAAKTAVPPWLLAFGGAGIVIGLGTYGYKVIEAVGKKITEITPTRGLSAEIGTATTVLICSKLGLPISTTFVLVGAVMGVGIARGFGALDLSVIKRIFASWLITIPVSAVFCAVIFHVLMYLRG